MLSTRSDFLSIFFFSPLGCFEGGGGFEKSFLSMRFQVLKGDPKDVEFFFFLKPPNRNGPRF